MLLGKEAEKNGVHSSRGRNPMRQAGRWYSGFPLGEESEEDLVAC